MTQLILTFPTAMEAKLLGGFV